MLTCNAASLTRLCNLNAMLRRFLCRSRAALPQVLQVLSDFEDSVATVFDAKRVQHIMRSQSCLMGVRREDHENAARARTRAREQEAERTHEIKLRVSRRKRAEFDVGKLWERLTPHATPMLTVVPGNEFEIVVPPFQPLHRGKSELRPRIRDATPANKVQYASSNYDLAPVLLPPAISPLEQALSRAASAVGSISDRAREWSDRQLGTRLTPGGHDPSLDA